MKFFKAILCRLLPTTYDSIAPVNAQAFSSSCLDGITLDRLMAILSASRDGNSDDLFAVYADIQGRDTTFIAGALQRKGPLVARPFSVTLPQSSDPQSVAARDFLRSQMASVKGRRVVIAHLLDASTWPVAVVEKVYRPAAPGSAHYYDLVELRPVPFWRLTFRADSNGPAGQLKVYRVNPDGTRAFETDPLDPARFVVHRGHLLQSLPDCWGGPMRAVVAWWFFAVWARQASANNLEQTNLPKFIARYSRVDAEKSRKELLRAFSRASTSSALVIPEDARVEAISTLKGETTTAFMDFIALCQREIAKVIIGQTLTLEAQAQGLGSGQSNVQADALSGIREFDAALLAETWEDQIFQPLLRANGIRSPQAPQLSWTAEDDAAQVKADMLNDLYLAGLRVRADGLDKLSGIVGLPMEYIPSKNGVLGLSAGDDRRVRQPVTVQGQAAIDELADAGAESLSMAMAAELAPVRRAVGAAKSPVDLESQIAAAVADFAPHRAVRVLEQIMSGSVANGLMAASESGEQ